MILCQETVSAPVMGSSKRTCHNITKVSHQWKVFQVTMVYGRGISKKIRTGWESQIRQQTSRRTRRTLALTDPSWFLVQRIPKFDLAWEYEWISSRNFCFTSSFSLMYQPSQMLSFRLQLWYRASRTQNIETLKHPNETAWNQWPLIQDFRSTIIGSRGTVQISDQKVGRSRGQTSNGWTLRFLLCVLTWTMLKRNKGVGCWVEHKALPYSTIAFPRTLPTRGLESWMRVLCFWKPI